MVKEHEDELGTSENQTKMDSIQLRFPNDNLQLDDNQQVSVTMEIISKKVVKVWCEISLDCH